MALSALTSLNSEPIVAFVMSLLVQPVRAQRNYLFCKYIVVNKLKRCKIYVSYLFQFLFLVFSIPLYLGCTVIRTVQLSLEYTSFAWVVCCPISNHVLTLLKILAFLISNRYVYVNE